MVYDFQRPSSHFSECNCSNRWSRRRVDLPRLVDILIDLNDGGTHQRDTIHMRSLLTNSTKTIKFQQSAQFSTIPTPATYQDGSTMINADPIHTGGRQLLARPFLNSKKKQPNKDERSKSKYAGKKDTYVS